MSTAEEKANIFRNFLNSLQKPVDIITLIDGSGSVSDDQFATMKFCMRTLATLFEFPPPPAPPPSDKDPVRIGAIQFDTQAYIVCDLGNDPIAYTTAVVSMPQKKGGTNAGAGFTTCLNLFKVQPRNASRVILLFTDGDVNAAEKVVPELVKSGIQIFSLGVGLSESHKSSVVAVSNQVIFVQNFTEMQNIISKLSVLPAAPPKLNMRTISAKKASFDIIYPESFDCVEVQLWEDGLNAWKTLPTASTPTYFIDSLASNKIYQIKGRVRTLTKAWTKESEPAQFRTLTENTETGVLKSASLPRVTNELISKINNYVTSQQWQLHGVPLVNIALLGNVGNGKSAYFNSIYSVLKGQYAEVQMHKVSTQTVTLTINKKFLTNKSIRLWDTYGWTSANSSYEREFQFLLEGAIPDGYKEGDEILGKLNNHPQIVDKVHAIVVIYEMPAVMTESNMGALKRFYNKMCDKNVQPIVVLTKVDLITEADLTGRLSDVYDSGVIDVYISQFCKASTIPRANVFPVVNFRGAWQERDFVAEKLLLNSFYTALSFAQAKVASLLEKRVSVYDKSDPTNPRQVAIVDSGSLDDNIQGLVERIHRELGLEQFQVYLKGSSTVVQKSSYTTTKFMSCASPTSHGYWELFGALPSAPSIAPVATTAGTLAASPTKAISNKPIEVGIFISDPKNPASKSIGSVMIAPSKLVAELRVLVSDEVEVPESYTKFQFANLGVPKSPLVAERDETSVTIATIMITVDDNARVRIDKAQAVEIGIMLDNNKKVGYVEDLPLETTLDAVKRYIVENTEVEFDFRFLTTSGNNVAPKQEPARNLKSIIIEKDDGEMYFVIRKV